MELKWLLFAFTLTGLAPASAQEETRGVEQAGGGRTAAETYVSWRSMGSGPATSSSTGPVSRPGASPVRQSRS